MHSQVLKNAYMNFVREMPQTRICILYHRRNPGLDCIDFRKVSPGVVAVLVIINWSCSQTMFLRSKFFGKHTLVVLSCLLIVALQTCSVLHFRQCTPMYGSVILSCLQFRLAQVKIYFGMIGSVQPCCSPFVSSVVCFVLFSFVRT
ncbi:hypothetical protein DER45DRAFT_221452 [Fusarium avenaceum]|nr:hypothetical protein DER45DRAFT_221452 [Fusarium avenaceum]